MEAYESLFQTKMRLRRVLFKGSVDAGEVERFRRFITPMGFKLRHTSSTSPRKRACGKFLYGYGESISITRRAPGPSVSRVTQ